MRRMIERFRNRFIDTARLGAVGLCLFGLCISMTAGLAFREVDIVREGGVRQTVLTISHDPAAILAAAGIAVSGNDEVIYQPDAAGGAVIYLNSSFTVPLVADGETNYIKVTSGTVADILQMADVDVGPHDVVDPAPGTSLARGMTVMVRRVEFAQSTRRVEVIDEQLEVYLASLPQEERDAFIRSKSRIYDVVFNDRLEDGARVGGDMMSLEAVYHPYDPPLTGFLPGVPCSTIDEFYGIELDENGIPTSYTGKMEGAACTAYSAPGGGLGAGGQGLYCGTVAVNPNVIPYGTRLYIAAADGSFIYGYAIASDCGTAMMEGRVDFDLFFETFEESCWFGRRALDVYILD